MGHGAVLTSTVNLGMADIYPATSGKARVAEYLAEYYGVPLAKSAFLCDDDNDVELARLVGKAYCPAVSSVRASSASVAADQTCHATWLAVRSLQRGRLRVSYKAGVYRRLVA